MTNEEAMNRGVETVDAPKVHGTSQATSAEAKGPFAETQANIAKVAEKAATVVGAMQTMAVEAKEAVSRAEGRARKAVTAVGARMRSEVKDVRASVAKARKAMRGAVQKVVGKNAKATGATRWKVAVRVKKAFAAKTAGKRKTVTRKRRDAKAGAQKVARKMKR